SDSESQNGDTSSQQSGNKCIQIPANCTICDMRFSNRANARRHERNIHGVILNPMGNNSSTVNGSISSSTPKSVLGTPKLISLIKKPKMQVLESSENWDYSNPQKYRSYLTPAKLSFILQNLEFLEQSQDMLCKCCDKQFPSYKFFMGHMRKRYHNLPRNVCFKCLKHFESKGQFIGHLKRKTCLNLYKIVMNDDTITKDLTPDNASKGAKEFLSDKTYACKLCPKQYPYKSELRNHVFELKEHPEYLKNKENDTLECAYCDKSFEDQTERKRHYNNLDCISFIVCGTCKDQVASNQAFVEHVYSIHLKKNTINGAESLFQSVTGDEENEAENLLDCSDEPISLSKQPQACPVCDKQYNNYYNVLRHMESKHPDQVPRIYECVKCFETFVRQSELKEHVARVHNLALISGKMIPLSNNVRSYICRECGETFNDMLQWLDHQVTHGKFNCNQCEYSCDSRDDLEDHLNTSHVEDAGNSPPKLKLKLYNCKECSNTYPDIEDEKMDDDVIDPTQFLAREDEDYSRDDDEPLEIGATPENDGENPPILTSLGLHSVNSGFGAMDFIKQEPGDPEEVEEDVQKDDRLSPKICHACISYLNSWQSFKNRCDAAQKKQLMWIGLMPQPNKNESMSGTKPQANILQQRLLQQHQQQQKQNQLASLLSQNRNITLQPIAPKTNLLQQQLQKKSTPPEPRPNLLQQQQRQLQQRKEQESSEQEMMNISLNNRPNRTCCRLCLAPENECVNIYMTSAADKEPLSLKINACVRIK
uniref:CSON007249 protein n=1 Tax=Culicoides sonorensis TaxID=179676 RepID=A0A336KEG1_CULSO